MLNPAIIIVAYNRVNSLKRLLKSIGEAKYPHFNIPLIISIDFARDNNEVIEAAHNFKWEYGTKEVISHEKNLGLRKHIIHCGAYSLKYGSVIVLEDDLYVSLNFYEYSKAALKFSEDRPGISGISLYNHQFNVHSRSEFSPIIDEYDNYYLQMASSWGQAWTKRHWLNFFEWYQQHDLIVSNSSLPKNVTSWSEKSWLKYFIAYLVETDTYFLYPRSSYSTNFNDAGTHIGTGSTVYQVPLNFGSRDNFNFSTLKNSRSVYDVFYENKKLFSYLNIIESELSVDLYGKKEISKEKKFLLTDKILQYKILKSFDRSLKPHDANVIANILGSEIFLYDCSIKQANPYRPNVYRKIMYNIKSINRIEAGIVFVQRIKEAINSVIFRK